MSFKPDQPHRALETFRSHLQDLGYTVSIGNLEYPEITPGFETDALLIHPQHGVSIASLRASKGWRHPVADRGELEFQVDVGLLEHLQAVQELTGVTAQLLLTVYENQIEQPKVHPCGCCNPGRKLGDPGPSGLFMGRLDDLLDNARVDPDKPTARLCQISVLKQVFTWEFLEEADAELDDGGEVAQPVTRRAKRAKTEPRGKSEKSNKTKAKKASRKAKKPTRARRKKTA